MAEKFSFSYAWWNSLCLKNEVSDLMFEVVELKMQLRKSLDKGYRTIVELNHLYEDLQRSQELIGTLSVLPSTDPKYRIVEDELGILQKKHGWV